MCCRQSGLINSAPKLSCLTARCAQGQSGVSNRFSLLKYWTYVVSAHNTWLCKVEYFGLIFAWLELGLQLVLFKVNQEMLFIYVAQTQDAAHMNVNQRRKPKILKFFNWFNFFADLFFLCVTRHLSKLNIIVSNNLGERT